MSSTKQSFFQSIVRAVQRRPAEADALRRVGQVAERHLREIEGKAADADKLAEGHVQAANDAGTRAARVEERSQSLRKQRDDLAGTLQSEQKRLSDEYARAVADGNDVEEQKLLSAAPARGGMEAGIAQLDAMLAGLDAEASRWRQVESDHNTKAEAAREQAANFRCEQSAVEYDEALNALLLASCRLFLVYEQSQRMLPVEVQRLRAGYFSGERAVIGELTGRAEPAGHPPPVLGMETVRLVVRAMAARQQAADQAAESQPEAT